MEPPLVQPEDPVYDPSGKQVAKEKNAMPETRFPPLAHEQMTDEQRAVVDAI